MLRLVGVVGQRLGVQCPDTELSRGLAQWAFASWRLMLVNFAEHAQHATLMRRRYSQCQDKSGVMAMGVCCPHPGRCCSFGACPLKSVLLEKTKILSVRI